MMLQQSRYDANISQEELASRLNRSRGTIQNWEKGTTIPDLFDIAEWFTALELSPIPYYLEYIYPNDFRNIKHSDPDEKIEAAFNKLLTNVTIEQKRALLYIAYASHGSDPNSVLQMVLADMHLPMAVRVSVAQMIVDNYEMCEGLGTLSDTEHILPDIENLKNAVKSGKDAAIRNKKSYT